MQWDKSLESDIPVIDHEHKELVCQLSNLLDESQPNRVQEMLDFLKDYVVKHFAHEQVIHKKCNYPRAAEHKQAHIDFIDRFNSLEELYLTKENDLKVLQTLIETVNNWLKEHIMGQDKEFAEYFKGLDSEQMETYGRF